MLPGILDQFRVRKNIASKLMLWLTGDDYIDKAVRHSVTSNEVTLDNGSYAFSGSGQDFMLVPDSDDFWFENNDFYIEARLLGNGTNKLRFICGIAQGNDAYIDFYLTESSLWYKSRGITSANNYSHNAAIPNRNYETEYKTFIAERKDNNFNLYYDDNKLSSFDITGKESPNITANLKIGNTDRTGYIGNTSIEGNIDYFKIVKDYKRFGVHLDGSDFKDKYYNHRNISSSGVTLDNGYQFVDGNTQDNIFIPNSNDFGFGTNDWLLEFNGQLNLDNIAHTNHYFFYKGNDFRMSLRTGSRNEIIFVYSYGSGVVQYNLFLPDADYLTSIQNFIFRRINNRIEFLYKRNNLTFYQGVSPRGTAIVDSTSFENNFNGVYVGNDNNTGNNTSWKGVIKSFRIEKFIN